jgi:hypothetical protein
MVARKKGSKAATFSQYDVAVSLEVGAAHAHADTNYAVAAVVTAVGDLRG